MMRTGSSAAVSAKWLARKDSKVLAIVGAGTVGRGSLATCNEVFPWEEVRVWSRSQETLDRFVAEEQPLYESFELACLHEPRGGRLAAPTSSSPERTRAEGSSRTRGSRPARTSRPSAPTSRASRSSRGSSSSGRASSSTTSASAARTGRSTSPCARASSAEEDVAGEIGKVIVGELAGRESDDQVTVFDSTGIALQDSATVPLEYERALAAGVGIEKKMIST